MLLTRPVDVVVFTGSEDFCAVIYWAYVDHGAASWWGSNMLKHLTFVGWGSPEKMLKSWVRTTEVLNDCQGTPRYEGGIISGEFFSFLEEFTGYRHFLLCCAPVRIEISFARRCKEIYNLWRFVMLERKS